MIFFISVKTVENDQGPDPWYEVRTRNVLARQPGAQARAQTSQATFLRRKVGKMWPVWPVCAVS